MRTPAWGFTLVELLVVLAILGILATLAVPSFNQMIEGERVKGAANDLYAALSITRSEAIKRNTSMNLNANTGGWIQGWKVVEPGSGTEIQDHSALRGSLSVDTSPGSFSSLVYRSSGRIQGGGNASFSITGSFSSSARCVCVGLSGRPAVVPGACSSSSC